MPETIATNQMLDDLTAIEGHRWSEWKRGKPLSARGLSSPLKPFGVRPRNHGFPNGNQAKAYFRADLEPHWKVYFPEAGGSYPPRRPNPVKTSTPCDFHPSRRDEGGTDRNCTNPLKQRGWDSGTDRSRGARRGSALEPLREPPAWPSRPSGEPLADNPYKGAKNGE